MTEENKIQTSNLSEMKNLISDFISNKIKGFIKSDREKLSETISLLMSDKTTSAAALDNLKNFYNKDNECKKIFFDILTNFDYENLEFLLNKIYAIEDTPRWLMTLADDLGRIIKEQKNNKEDIAPAKKVLNNYRKYFAKIFNFQYLIIKEYNAQTTPVSLLKYIAAKEGVHPAQHWSDFEERLNSPDRILLGLEHFKIPSMPIVYIEVAFSKGLLKSIHSVLGKDRVVYELPKCDTAIFYSVNNTFGGLSGIGLGEKMIIKAKEYIEKYYPNIRNFSTLSPLPLFAKYLKTVLSKEKHNFELKKEDIQQPGKKNKFFSLKARQEIIEEYNNIFKNPKEDFADILLDILETKDWYKNDILKKNLATPMIELVKFYLLNEKRFNPKTREKMLNAYDPVANFHLSNGAYIGSINYLANLTDRGLKESYSMMMNYVYDEKKLDKNKIKYSHGEIIIKKFL